MPCAILVLAPLLCGSVRRGANAASAASAARRGDRLLVPRTAGREAITLASGLQAPADLVIDRRRGWLVVPENAAPSKGGAR